MRRGEGIGARGQNPLDQFPGYLWDQDWGPEFNFSRHEITTNLCVGVSVFSLACVCVCLFVCFASMCVCILVSFLVCFLVYFCLCVCLAL